MAFDTPLLIVCFNRPDLVGVLVDAIRPIRPSKIYLSSDGPRKEREGESDLVAATRDAFVDAIDWDCELKTRFLPANAGLVAHTVGAIDWVFEAETEVLILEDDCIPHPDFFGYGAELLRRFRTQTEVKCVLGDNSAKIPVRGHASYTFSKYALPTWGMGLWKRSWNEFDRNLDSWLRVRNSRECKELWPNKHERRLMVSLLDRVKFEENHSWGYVWMYSVQLHRGFAVVPRHNLISNRGFQRADAAHTRGESLKSNYPTRAVLPLNHPRTVELDRRASRIARDGRLFGLKKNRVSYRLSKFFRKKIRGLMRGLRSS